MITKEEFYERYVNHWMRSDINSMRNHGNNFPLALCTLSYKEFLDSLDQFKITLDKEENIKNFGARIKEMTDRTAELETDHLHKLTEFIFPVQARDSTGSIFTEIAPSSGPTKLVSQTIAGYPMAISALDNGVVIKEQEHDRNSE